MDESNKIILLKLTGTCLLNNKKELDITLINSIAKQISQLKNYRFAIVIGGGNLFRGDQQGKKLGIIPNIGHQIGMLATVINGLLIKNSFEEHSIDNIILSSIENHFTGKYANLDNINEALKNKKTIIFVAGTGNPFFSTDTAAVLRSLQINAHQIWKATNVDGIYDSDPAKNPDAKFIKNLSLTEAIIKKNGIMDLAAFALASQHSLSIRVFNIFTKDALIKASEDNNFGSLVS